MPAKARVLASILTAAAIAGLALIGLVTKDKHYADLLLITPISETETGLSAKIVKEKLENKFPITYECGQSAMIEAINTSKAADVIATNFLYTSVMPCPTLSGGFFTQDHQDRAAKTAVLNEKAAFDLFGGVSVYGSEMKINGESYSVLGVIRDDYADLLRVYIPISRVDLNPSAFMVRLDNTKGISQEYVMNEGKQAGLTDSRYDFIHLGTRAERVPAMCLFALIILTSVGLFLFLRFCFSRLRRLIQRIQTDSKQFYAHELFLRKPLFIVAFVWYGILILNACSWLIWLLRQTVSGFLRYEISGILNLFTIYTTAAFHERVSFLAGMGLYSDAVFIVFLAGLIFTLNAP
ncbi:MAG: ABC transporter permease [Clostridiales bacterium]|nr:ABC transporter permease [Clostridiales bacterium]